MNILERIVSQRKRDMEDLEKKTPLHILKNEIKKETINHDFIFEKALKQKDITIIAEVKKASPSKGIIKENFDYISIAKQYQEAKADAISVLTEPVFFQGSDEYLTKILQEVSIPVLRKDFIINEYMIYQSKYLKCHAILLIVSLFSKEELQNHIHLAHELGLSVLTETHSEEEVETALAAGANIIGINNRDLKSFQVNLETTERLSKLIPKNKIIISESGIATREDMEFLSKLSIHGVLIGETFMKSKDIFREIKELKGLI